ncbi:hypothetical protein ASG85_03900 [Paenibacillus sp. Soil724D2]|nr:hypothetical protein ASG85_03900 [Paenibacillus sp. Soil724D2]
MSHDIIHGTDSLVMNEKDDMIGYAEQVPEHGLYFMDSPGNDIECVSGMAAGGVHIVCFTTGRGTPTGSAVVPVIKITANKFTYSNMEDNMDVDVSSMLAGTLNLEQTGEQIWQEICELLMAN